MTAPPNGSKRMAWTNGLTGFFTKLQNLSTCQKWQKKVSDKQNMIFPYTIIILFCFYVFVSVHILFLIKKHPTLLGSQWQSYCWVPSLPRPSRRSWPRPPWTTPAAAHRSDTSRQRGEVGVGGRLSYRKNKLHVYRCLSWCVGSNYLRCLEL